MKKMKFNTLVLIFLKNFGINENCNAITLTFSFHLSRKTNGDLDRRIMVDSLLEILKERGSH